MPPYLLRLKYEKRVLELRLQNRTLSGGNRKKPCHYYDPLNLIYLFHGQNIKIGTKK